MTSYLNVEKLILVGFRKNYIIPFNHGVNIIYGDSDTGKSSILEFINYLLGSSSVELADEIVAAIDYAALEIKINGVIYTVKRNIYDSNAYIEVYRCNFDDCNDYYPNKYSPNFRIKSAPDGFYSDFLLDSLNFPKVKIKVSPSKENSDVKRLGFRNLFKYCYLNQDDVGSKSFLDLGNWVKYSTNKEVFKYIFNVLDSSITELELEISNKTKEGARIRQKYLVVSEFLRETDYESLNSIDESIESIDSNLENLKEELKKINESMLADSESYLEIKSIFNELLLNEKRVAAEIVSIEKSIDKYSRLKNDYNNDIAKIKSLILVKEKIGKISIELSPCPICDNEIRIGLKNVPFLISPTQALEEELDSLIKRQRNIQELINSQSSKYKDLIKERLLYQKDILKAREMLDTESKEMITPYLTQRDAIIKEISAQSQRRENYVNNLKIINKQDDIFKTYRHLYDSIEKLKEQLNDLKKGTPDLQSVFNKLGDFLNKYLIFINIKNRHGVKISDKTFTPVIRDKDYFKITSGGLRTITSIGYMLGILEYSIEEDINHPRLLMIDTVGKYLGKMTKDQYMDETNTKDDLEEGISDPLKYRNIYESIINIASRAEDKGKPCQIILVDNDVPDTFVENYKGFIVAHYSSTGANGLKFGLIDDVYNS